jgi:hypothetical protein
MFVRISKVETCMGEEKNLTMVKPILQNLNIDQNDSNSTEWD